MSSVRQARSTFDCGYEIPNRLSSYLVLNYFIQVSVFPLVTIQPDGGLYEWPKHVAGFLKSGTQWPGSEDVVALECAVHDSY